MRRFTATVLSLTAFCFVAENVLGQVTAGRQVLGCFGKSVPPASGIAVSSTAGEAAVGTAVGTNYVVTSGFHQPSSAGGLFFDVITGPSSCPTSTDGTAAVIGIRGCTPPYTVTWSNGVTGNQNERLAPGFHTVTVTASDCARTSEFEITADPEGTCVLRFFNAFSPNGDGRNDRWEIENIDLPEFSENRVEIFNRWGTTVWSGTNYNNRDVVWAGETSGGNALPDGTYFFVAVVGGTTHKGYVELTK